MKRSFPAHADRRYPRAMQAPDELPAWDPPELSGIGFVGEGDDDTVGAAESWLRSRGLTHVRGPVAGATWYPYRTLMGGSERPPFLGEPSARPEPWQARGYEVCAWYSSTLTPHGPTIDKGALVGRDRLAEGWTLRSMADLDDLDSCLQLLHRLSHAGFAEAYCFTPLPYPAFDELYRPFVPLYEPELVLFAYAPDGTPAGFTFTIPDVLNPDLRQLVVKTVAVDPAFRRLGLGTWLIGEAHGRAQARGLDGGGIHALMWADSKSNLMGTDDSRLVRRYALWEKRL